MANGWTAERRARQAEMIHRWQPWKNSTGARTPEGRAICSKNILVGNVNRQKALEQARAELEVAILKIKKLTRKRKEWWEC